MEALDHPVKADEVELQFLLDWRGQRGGSPRKQAWVASLFIHAALVAGLTLLPPTRTRLNAPGVLADLARPTPLVAPPAELTQREPNRGKIGREFDLESLMPRPPLRVPPAPPSTTRPAAPMAALPERKLSAPSLPEPPKVEGSRAVAQLPPLGAPIPIAPPQIQTQERPKLAFERPGLPETAGQPSGRIPAPSTSVAEAARSAARLRGGGLIVGDLGEGLGGIGEALNLPPSPGRGSTLELLSDPMGVDFRPYLIRILSTVRRNWYAVIPESAKLGRQGRVVIQFAISRDGAVPKLIIASPSGTEALDRAAVAGISASNPFPPLPSEFRGHQVRLQFTFLYNMPSR